MRLNFCSYRKISHCRSFIKLTKPPEPPLDPPPIASFMCYTCTYCTQNMTCLYRGRSRERVQGIHPPPTPSNEAFFIFAFKICLLHQSVLPVLSGARSRKKNLESTPALF